MIRLALITLCAFALLAGTAVAAEPIEGVWRSLDNPQVEVLFQRTASGAFQATTITGDPPGTCRSGPNGFITAVGPGSRVRGSGTSYSGTVLFRDTFDCSPVGEGQVTISIDPSNPAAPSMLDCSNPPGQGAPEFDSAGNPVPPTRCDHLQRIRGPEPTPRIERMFRFPTPRRAGRCIERRRIRTRFRSPLNDILVLATISINGRVVRTLRYPNVGRTVTLTFPRGRWRLTVTAETASGRRLSRTRTFTTCGAT